MRLGVRQLTLLRNVGTTASVVVPDALTRRLCDIGFLKAHGPGGSFAAVTPAGLRALADAVEAGRIGLFQMPERKG